MFGPYSLNCCGIVNGVATSCPAVGNAIGQTTTTSTAGSSHCRAGPMPSEYASPSITRTLQRQPSSNFAARPPPVTRNQQGHGIRSGKHYVFTVTYS